MGGRVNSYCGVNQITVNFNLKPCFLLSLSLPLVCLKKSLISHAIHLAAQQHYVKNSIPFEIILNSYSLYSLDETLKLMRESKAYKITRVSSNIKDLFDVNNSAIFLFTFELPKDWRKNKFS